MIKTVILLCALGMARSDCTMETAMTVIQGPDTTSLASCGFVGQAYLAETSLAGYVNDGHYLKLLCTSGDQQDAKQRPAPMPQDFAQTVE